MSRFGIKKKGIATVTIKVLEPAVNGYKTQTFVADIQKLYGEEKDAFMAGISARTQVDTARQLVRKLDRVEWFVEEDGVPVKTLAGKDLEEFFADMEESPVDYFMGPLAQECVAVQDEKMRAHLERKN